MENADSRKPGGQPNNLNAVKHGGRSKRYGLVHARLGRKFANAYCDMGRFRLAVEDLAGLNREDMPLKERLIKYARVQTLLRLEEGARACELMIRKNPAMGPEEIRQQRYAIREFSRERDRLLMELLSDGKGTEGDAWDALEQQRGEPVPEPPPEVRPGRLHRAAREAAQTEAAEDGDDGS